MTKYHHRWDKRLLDLLLLAVAAPMVLVLALVIVPMIWLTDGVPALFRQQRMGHRGETFTMYKLRTMRQNGDGMEITAMGRMLRRLRLDELPQMINILNGSMSWVGPRPEQVHFAEALMATNPEFGERHAVRPGITGLAQIRMPHATVEDNMDKLPHDLEYIANANCCTDLNILWQTFAAILKKRKA